MYAFVDGAVDINRRRDQGGAGFGGAGVVLVQAVADSITAYRIIGVPFWPHSMLITNNTMEVMATKIACDLRDHKEVLHLWSDSMYVKNMLTLGSSYVAQANTDLIAYARWSTAHEGVWIHHCKGHAGFAWNELSDMAATKAVALRKGFDKTYGCNISRLCFRCSRFPCAATDARRFAVETACLKSPRAYAGIVECERFKASEVEGLEA
jgi:ribonuclease HI